MEFQVTQNYSTENIEIELTEMFNKHDLIEPLFPPFANFDQAKNERISERTFSCVYLFMFSLLKITEMHTS